MLTTIQPSNLLGMIQAPASKSSMQRACAAALLSRGVTIIRNPGYSNDDKAALGVIRDMGAIVTTQEDGSLKVISGGVAPVAGSGPVRSGGASVSQGNTVDGGNAGAAGPLEVNCGESGLGIRMFAPIFALSDRAITVNGEGSLLSRPMDFFDEIFPQLGIRVVSNKGKLPLQIQGPLQPRTIAIDGSLSSQFLTGLLFSYAASGASGVSIKVNNLKSKPYIDLTLQVMRHFGWEVENRNYEEFYFPPAGGRDAAVQGVGIGGSGSPEVPGKEPVTRNYTVEGDWSGGAFLLVAGAIAGPVTVRGLDPSSTQADKAILGALHDCGASLSVREGEMEIGPRGTAGGSDGAGTVGAPGGAGVPGSAGGAVALKAFQFDATDCPDLFPPLVALASFCKGTTVIHGVGRLAHKESNRALTLQEEFGKMGVSIALQDDVMLIRGGEGVKGAVVHSRHDHRIAMACAVAGLRADGATTIEEAQAINKSYPDFYTHLQQLGAEVTMQEAVGNAH